MKSITAAIKDLNAGRNPGFRALTAIRAFAAHVEGAEAKNTVDACRAIMRVEIALLMKSVEGGNPDLAERLIKSLVHQVLGDDVMIVRRESPGEES